MELDGDKIQINKKKRERNAQNIGIEDFVMNE